jgi:DNA-binding helix-hairpin-helix protein with protein kinase domain
MMTDGSGRVFAGDGRALTLGQTLKSGGAGSIHRIVELPELVGKIYHPDVDHGIYERKVEAMISLVPDLPDITEDGAREVQITWPRFLLRDGQRRFVGFAMPLLDFATSVELECVLQERQARAQGLPTGLGAKVTLAANMASLIAEVHRQGHFVIDLKPVNLRFYRRSLHIAMLDCDGFSIKGNSERFPAPQFTPEYLAPEFQIEGLSAGAGDQASRQARQPNNEQSQEESQDRFALAVVIFQLLNFGIHPFTGRPTSERVPTDIPGRIAHHCYAYGVRPNPEMGPNPASGHTAMPAELRLLFDRAFGAVGMARPSADDWVSRLRAYGRRSTGLLIACQANAHHQHFAGLPCAACARAALLNRASSVVRTPAMRAPQWTARRPAPPAYPAGWPPIRVPLQPPPPATWTQSGTPSWAPRPGKTLGYLLGFLLVPLLALCSSWSSSSHRSRNQYIWKPETEQERSAREPQPEKPGPAGNLDDVLDAARGSSKEAFARQLSRLPSLRGETDEKECEAAKQSWLEAVEWTKDDRAFARDRHLSPYEPSERPCVDFFFLGPRIVRTQELCKARLDSPGAYSGSGEEECDDNRVLQTGVDTLQRVLLRGYAIEPFTWKALGDAFLLTDDSDSAEGAYVIAAHFFKVMSLGADVRSHLGLETGWLRKREQILMAKAWAKVDEWSDEAVPDELTAMARAPWPKQPPPKKPQHRPAQQ